MTEQQIGPEQLEQLQIFLIQHHQADHTMPLDIAHGFMTAILSGPNPIGADVWLAYVLGDLVDDEFTEETESMMDLLQLLYQQIQADLESGMYGPLILQQESEDQEPLPLPYGWCQGYLAGLDMHGEEAREHIQQDEQASAMMMPIFAFLMYEQEHLLCPPDEDAHRQTVSELPDAAVGLYHWWKGQSATFASGSCTQ